VEKVTQRPFAPWSSAYRCPAGGCVNWRRILPLQNHSLLLIRRNSQLPLSTWAWYLTLDFSCTFQTSHLTSRITETAALHGKGLPCQRVLHGEIGSTVR
jgi:hypothetical protein